MSNDKGLAMSLKLPHKYDAPRGPVAHSHPPGLTPGPKDSNSAGLGQGQRIFIFDKLPGDADAAGR